MTKTQSDDIAISVHDVHKEFTLPQSKNSTFKQTVVNIVKKNNKVTQKVLDGVSFDVKKGDFFGIVGRNGSGKSTLLKILAGVYTPAKGKVQINGQLTPFIELGVGFNPELSGRDNVYLNGALLGFTRKQMDEMYDGIVDFAELELFMDQKLKNYSSGMQVRLAFSIAIKAQGDILLLDEVLAVGDEAFQRRCFSYFEELRRNKKTVILVTHDMASVEKFCTNAIFIESGKIVEMGDPKIVAHAYRRLFSKDKDSQKMVDSKRWGTRDLSIKEIKIHSIKKKDSRVNIDITLQNNSPTTKDAILAYTLKTKERRALFGSGATAIGTSKMTQGEEAVYRLSFDNILGSGDYYLDLSVGVTGADDYFDFWIDATNFSVDNVDETGSSIVSNSEVSRLTGV